MHGIEMPWLRNQNRSVVGLGLIQLALLMKLQGELQRLRWVCLLILHWVTASVVRLRPSHTMKSVE